MPESRSSYHVDGLSVLFMLMGTVIGGSILLYSVRYMEHEPEGTTRFYILMLSFIAGFTLLVGAANLLLIYVAWEAMGLCSYFLVGFWYRQQPAVDGARKVLVITHVAGYGLFAAIVMLYVAHRHVRLDGSGHGPGPVRRPDRPPDRGRHGEVRPLPAAHAGSRRP